MDVPPQFVLFADLLGFKRLVIEHPVPLWTNLDFRGRPSRQLVASLMGGGNPLGAAFRAFHGSIEGLLDDVAFTQPAQVKVFSDSLFLSTKSHVECFHFAEQLMRRCVAASAPVRMGVGFGSFVSYGFAMEESPTLHYLSSQFFGAGVIYAVHAEKCLKGMRIGLHGKAVDALRAEAYCKEKILELPLDERREGVAHEWSYVGRWTGEPTTSGHRDPEPEVGRRLLTVVDSMRQRASDAEDVQIHYRRTTEALNRMLAHVEASPRANQV
jgi:hypothetical protein